MSRPVLHQHLYDFIWDRNLEGVQRVLNDPSFEWKTNGEDGFLYALFPEEQNYSTVKRYDPEFSKECFQLMLEHTFDPSLDRDVGVDFFTASHAPAFKDFALTLKGHPALLAKTLVPFVSLWTPHYTNRLEHALHPSLQAFVLDGKTLLEYVLRNWIKYSDCVTKDDLEEYVKTTKALLGLGKPPHVKRLVGLVKQLPLLPYSYTGCKEVVVKGAQEIEAMLFKHSLADAVNPSPKARSRKKM